MGHREDHPEVGHLLLRAVHLRPEAARSGVRPHHLGGHQQEVVHRAVRAGPAWVRANSPRIRKGRLPSLLRRVPQRHCPGSARAAA